MLQRKKPVTLAESPAFSTMRTFQHFNQILYIERHSIGQHGIGRYSLHGDCRVLVAALHLGHIRADTSGFPVPGTNLPADSLGCLFGCSTNILAPDLSTVVEDAGR